MVSHIATIKLMLRRTLVRIVILLSKFETFYIYRWFSFGSFISNSFGVGPCLRCARSRELQSRLIKLKPFGLCVTSSTQAEHLNDAVPQARSALLSITLILSGVQRRLNTRKPEGLHYEWPDTTFLWLITFNSFGVSPCLRCARSRELHSRLIKLKPFGLCK